MTRYRPFDQKRHLEGPPWYSGPELDAWEEAHGHDVRVKCYVEYGCKALDDHYEELKERVEKQERLLREAKDTLLPLWMGSPVNDMTTYQRGAKDLFYRIKDHLEKEPLDDA